MSMCENLCIQVWPPVLINNCSDMVDISYSGMVNASLIGAFVRDDGTIQLEYNGMPLYYFIGDNSTDNITGEGIQDLWGLWHIVNPDGGIIQASNVSLSNSTGNATTVNGTSPAVPANVTVTTNTTTTNATLPVNNSTNSSIPANNSSSNASNAAIAISS